MKRQQQTWLGQLFMGYNLWPRYLTQGNHGSSARRRTGDWGKLCRISLAGLFSLLVAGLVFVTTSPPIGHAVGNFAALFVDSMDRGFVVTEEVEILLTDKVLDSREPWAGMEPAKISGGSRARQMHSAIPYEPQGADFVCANGMIPGIKENRQVEEKEKDTVRDLERVEAATKAGKKVKKGGKANWVGNSGQVEDVKDRVLLSKSKKDKKRERRVRRGRVLLQKRQRTTRTERVLMGGGASELPDLTWAGSLRGASEGACEAGLFYVYNLPKKLNVDLVRHCKKYHPYFCWKVEQQGLGPSLLLEDSDCKKIPGTYSHLLGDLTGWHRTHQFSLESTYHARLMQHPCRTDNPQHALVFYMPFYAGLAFDIVLNVSSDFAAVNELPNQFLTWLEKQSYFRRHGGVDHFLVLGRGAYDFRWSEKQPWGSTLLNSPLLKNVTKLTFDRDLWDVNMAGIPYPTFFHPSTDEQLRAWQQRIRNTPRRWRASFVGSKERNLGHFSFSTDSFGFRSMLVNECEAWDDCAVLDCKDLGTGKEISACYDPGPPMELYLNSDFCLQPRGDTPPRKAIFDSMVAGCIPVFFHNDTAYSQYLWYFPMERERYSVFIDMKMVREGNTSMVEVLSRYSQREIDEMRRVVIDEILPGIIILNPDYPGPRNTRDAVSRAVDGMMVKMGRHFGGLNCEFPTPWMIANKPKLSFSRMRPATPGEDPSAW